MPEHAPPHVQQLQRGTFVGRKDAPVGKGFMDGAEGHAEIQWVQRPFTKHPFLPTRAILNFFDRSSGTGVEADSPILAPNVALGFTFGLEPFIAKQQADRLAAA